MSKFCGEYGTGGNCPVCGKKTYSFFSGMCNRSKKLTPDTGECSACGFHYSEHIQHSLEEQVREFKASLKRKEAK